MALKMLCCSLLVFLFTKNSNSYDIEDVIAPRNSKVLNITSDIKDILSIQVIDELTNEQIIHLSEHISNLEVDKIAGEVLIQVQNYLISQANDLTESSKLGAIEMMVGEIVQKLSDLEKSMPAEKLMEKFAPIAEVAQNIIAKVFAGPVLDEASEITKATSSQTSSPTFSITSIQKETSEIVPKVSKVLSEEPKIVSGIVDVVLKKVSDTIDSNGPLTLPKINGESVIGIVKDVISHVSPEMNLAELNADELVGTISDLADGITKDYLGLPNSENEATEIKKPSSILSKITSITQGVVDTVLSPEKKPLDPVIIILDSAFDKLSITVDEVGPISLAKLDSDSISDFVHDMIANYTMEIEFEELQGEEMLEELDDIAQTIIESYVALSMSSSNDDAEKELVFPDNIFSIAATISTISKEFVRSASVSKRTLRSLRGTKKENILKPEEFDFFQ